ncbi:peptidyl-prolyl isomerase [gamma proteobacterium HTCC5015]|nr:peptidyl-prolyl isomerase [gamma proteobacterium HTCC5015]
MIKLSTNHGDITIELFDEHAPITCANFRQYVEEGHYNGCIFHRVIPDFMIQAGGFDTDMNQKPTRDPIQNEANNGISNEVGTLAMARTPDPHSASAQFFINTKHNAFLDFQAETAQGWGYAVFGKVTDGMDVVRAIEAVATGNHGMHQNVPTEPVIIEKAEAL